MNALKEQTEMLDPNNWDRVRNQLMVWIGDNHAVDWMMNYLSIVEFFDDIIDDDKEIPEQVAFNCMHDALIHFPSNPFFQKHYPVLVPQIMLGMRNYSLANKLEKRGTNDDLIFSYVMRCFLDITMTVIELTRGMEYADAIELEVHDWSMNNPQSSMEKYSEYQKEHT